MKLGWTLEDILKIFNCSRPFNKDGKLSVNGYEAYNKLLAVLDGVQEITNGIPNLDNVVAELEKIINENS